MEKYFNLTIKIGSRIFSSDKGDFIIEEVPDDALDRLMKGATWLELKPEANELLLKQSLLKLEKLRDLRERQGFLGDVEIIQKAINQLQSKTPEESGIPKKEPPKPKSKK